LGDSCLGEGQQLEREALRSALTDPVAPLPHYRPTKGKILVRWSEFVVWMETFRVNRAEQLDAVVEEALKDLRDSRQVRPPEWHPMAGLGMPIAETGRERG
jgi:hypothetical protein